MILAEKSLFSLFSFFLFSLYIFIYFNKLNTNSAYRFSFFPKKQSFILVTRVVLTLTSYPLTVLILQLQSIEDNGRSAFLPPVHIILVQQNAKALHASKYKIYIQKFR